MSTTTVERTREGTVPAFARGPVLAVAGAVGVALTAVSGRYGYFGDELYFIAAGHHLAWGYADQPPLLPLIAVAMDAIAPGSLPVLRIPATLAIMASVVLAALLAREFNGGRRAQLIAAGTVAVSPGLLATGHLLATSTLDPALWIALTWLLVRWVRTRSDRLLLAAAIVTAVALQVKFLVLGFWAVAIVAVLVCGPREMLRRPALWVGGAIAVLASVPTLVWQAQNGWPQLVEDVQAAYRALPPDVARDGVVVTGDYWSYSAVQYFASDLPSYSFSRGPAWFGVPPEDSRAVIFVGDPTALAPAFDQVTRVGALDNDVRVNNLAQGNPIFLLDGRKRPWAQLWDEVRHL